MDLTSSWHPFTNSLRYKTMATADYKTAEVIARDTEHLDGLAERRAVLRAYRTQDESHLWPIRGRFNITNRAAREVNKLEHANGAIAGLEYCYALECAISEIVNNENNW